MVMLSKLTISTTATEKLTNQCYYNNIRLPELFVLPRLHGEGRFINEEGLVWTGKFRNDSALNLEMDLQILRDFKVAGSAL